MIYSDGRIISAPFMLLPTRKELPHYYQVIKKPIDIKKILHRIEDKKVCLYFLYCKPSINTKTIEFVLTIVLLFLSIQQWMI